MVSLLMTLNDPNSNFKVAVFFQIKSLKTVHNKTQLLLNINTKSYAFNRVVSTTSSVMQCAFHAQSLSDSRVSCFTFCSMKQKVSLQNYLPFSQLGISIRNFADQLALVRQGQACDCEILAPQPSAFFVHIVH